MTEVKRQKRKVGVAGGFFNQLMGNNSTEPKVGEWATILHYSDRSVAKVVEVSEDGKTAKLEYYDTSADGSESGHGHQGWKHEPSGRFFTLRWKYKDWYQEGFEFKFTPEFIKEYQAAGNLYGVRYLKEKYPDQHKEIYSGDHPFPCKEVSGITKRHKTYHKMSIIFGVCQFYYDWSF